MRQMHVVFPLIVVMFIQVGLTKNRKRIKRLISNPNHVECRGTQMGISVSGTSQDHFDLYKRRYTNCSYVHGNLEITNLNTNRQDSEQDWDLSFLESIEVVTGYVLIYSVFVKELHLENLRLIRGGQLFSFKGDTLYSLVIASNSKSGSTTQGLMQLGFKSLQEIMNGIVYFYNNNLLCFEQTIHWADINVSVTPHAKYSFNNTYHKRKCDECHPLCYNEKTDATQCWGEGPDMCQLLNHASVCSQTCGDRCFSSDPYQCCHPECAAGCRGPKKTDCYACKHFFDDGECVSRCSPHQVYNTYKFEMEENPDGKYTYDGLCLKNCPNYLMKDTKFSKCVHTCRTGFHDVNGTCVECDGPCPKACAGHDSTSGEYLTTSNINQFENCTIVYGNLKIVEASFIGDTQYKISGVTIADLQILKSIKEVTGYIMIQSNYTNFQNLSFLSNLEVIHGREVDATQSSLNIKFTQLKNLDLISLRQIKNGHVTIEFNDHLCYISDINFTPMFVHKNVQMVRKTKNKKEDICRVEGEVCDRSCSDDGCWFKGPDNCLQCRKFKIDNSSNICINDCSQLPKLYEVGRLCKFCDEECESTCSGHGPYNCHKCKHYAVTRKDKDGKMIKKCLKECPEMFYPDQDSKCQICDAFCDDGCTGPSNTVMNGGCKSCKIGKEGDHHGDTNITCMDPNDEYCPVGFYRHTVSQSHTDDPLAGKLVCKRCHDMCNNCIGSGSDHCIACKYTKQFEHCVDHCYQMFYQDSNNICQGCHEQCRDSCSGPTAADCKACKNFKVYWEDTYSQHRFNCTKKCPDDKTHHVESDDPNDEGLIVCADASNPKVQTKLNTDKADKDAEKKKTMVIAVSAVGGIIVFVSFVFFIFFFLRKIIKKLDNIPKTNENITECENEGEKLMKLPSQFEHKNDVTKSFSAEASEEIMLIETDTNLQPHIHGAQVAIPLTSDNVVLKCGDACAVTDKQILRKVPQDIHLRRMAIQYTIQETRELAMQLGMQYNTWQTQHDTLLEEPERMNFVILRICLDNSHTTFRDIIKAVERGNIQNPHTICKVLKGKPIDFVNEPAKWDLEPSEDHLNRMAPLVGNKSCAFLVELGMDFQTWEQIRYRQKERDLVKLNRDILQEWKSTFCRLESITPSLRHIAQAFNNIGKNITIIEKVLADIL